MGLTVGKLLIWTWLMVNTAGVAYGEWIGHPRFALPLVLGVLAVGLGLALLFLRPERK
jgi:uncharacterized membrane protein